MSVSRTGKGLSNGTPHHANLKGSLYQTSEEESLELSSLCYFVLHKALYDAIFKL
jgi:hypothetical protein